MTVPGWQTEELQDEWPDSDGEHDGEQDGNSDDDRLSYGTQSVSFTAPLTTQIHSTADFIDHTPGSARSQNVGTFLVRDDVANVPLLPKTPGRNKSAIKDFFTPLPLERMFEPPSPPPPPASLHPKKPLNVSQSRRSPISEDEIIETDIPNMNSFHGRKPSLACQFTFAVPRASTSRVSGGFPQAQSTPNPPHPHPHPAPPTAPPTDPRLRLFQFQYDTYTREHLSAMVDSIAVNTPSGTGTGTPTTGGMSRHVDAPGVGASDMRSAKRLKLSPPGELGGDGVGLRATISRPKLFGKDYVGESRSLMQQIKEARDYSTISTVASGQNNSPSISHSNIADKTHDRSVKPHSPNESIRRPSSLLSVPEPSSEPSSASGTIGSRTTYSSHSYRQKAAALMEQIKSDVKGQKRVFSGDSEISRVTTQIEDTNSLTAASKISAEGKENLRHSSSSHRRSSASKLNSSRSSPRTSFKRSGLDANLVHDFSRISIQEQRPVVNVTFIPPPVVVVDHDMEGLRQQQSRAGLGANFPSIRATTNDDLNRFVSSSTASGTTLTAGSAPSFVKHAGPAHIRTIAPTDIPTLPDRFGDMVLDKKLMRWVKNTARAMEIERSASQSEASEDPFGDIDTIGDESRASEHIVSSSPEHDVSPLVEMSKIDEQSEDEEELELSNFSTDASAHIVPIMTGVETDEYEDDETTDSESENDDIHTATRLPPVINDIDFDSEFEDSPSRQVEPGHLHLQSPSRSPARPSTSHVHRSPNRRQHLQVSPHPPVLATPNRGSSASIASTPVIKSALKSTGATPTSALKYGSQSRYQTPLQRKSHRRSVSFSDGKRDGPMRDILPSGGAAQSVRSKRIAEMMNALENSDIEDDDSPSKASSHLGRPEELQPLGSRRPSNQASGSPGIRESPRRVFSRSYSYRHGESPNAKANGTFLTECSFGVAHDRLVQVITDVQPFEPHWEQLNSIDLSNAKLESVARLKEFLPRLHALSLNGNELAWLSGIPATVRTLSVASNCLTGITSYNHLLNLENLDISNNEVESLRQLECLRHLRELKADGNKITSLDGLDHMDGLVKLSLERNKIQTIDLEQHRWSKLEMLNVSHNRISSLRGLSSLQALIALNMDMNLLDHLLIEGTMARLRILRVSGNRLRKLLDVGMLPNLRTLYADNNSLTGLASGRRLAKLENLSLRNQSGRGLELLTRDVRDVKRLYLSGNPLKTDFLKEPCYNLIYLEVAACRLTGLPEGMARLLPNLRVLNLNYNFLEDVRPLHGLTRLQKLTIIGSRLKSTKPLIRLLQGMPDAEMLDFRMNPCTLGWYLPLLVKDAPGALQPSEGGGGQKGKEGWQEMDSKFRRDLPDESYIGRLAYRGLIMRGCRGLVVLDGVGVTEKERMKAEDLLGGILGERK